MPHQESSHSATVTLSKNDIFKLNFLQGLFSNLLKISYWVDLSGLILIRILTWTFSRYRLNPHPVVGLLILEIWNLFFFFTFESLVTMTEFMNEIIDTNGWLWCFRGRKRLNLRLSVRWSRPSLVAACMPDPAVLWVKNSYRNGRNTHTLIFENLTPEISI